MRADEVISIVDALKPNEISEELKLYWINEVEGRVHCEIYKSSIDELNEIKTMDQDLAIPMPYAKIYLSYLLGMMVFASKEYDLYADIIVRYEREFSEYAKFCLRQR